jgi:hypothetical protein
MKIKSEIENKRSPEKVTSLKATLEDFTKLIHLFSQMERQKSENGKELNPVQKVSSDFLVRTMLNIEGILPIIELYKTKRALIQPIGLIMRSILSDFLTLHYLLTFWDPADKENLSFKNELTLFDRDFLKSIMEMQEMEPDLKEFLKGNNSKFPTKDDIKMKHEQYKASVFNHLFDKNGKWKQVRELRSTSKRSLFSEKGDDFANPNSFVTEKYKWTRISQSDDLKKYILVFFGYKMFSQLQHFSKMSMQFLEPESEGHLFYYLVISVNAIFLACDVQIQLIGGQDHELLVELRRLEAEIDKILS